MEVELIIIHFNDILTLILSINEIDKCVNLILIDRIPAHLLWLF